MFLIHSISGTDAPKESAGQIKISQDSLDFQLAKLQNIFDASNIDSAFVLSKALLSDAEAYDNNEVKVRAQLFLAKVYNRKNEFVKSDSVVTEALGYSTENDITFSLCILSYNNSIRQSSIDKAKKFLDHAKQYIGDPKGHNMVRYRYCLADYYSYINDDTKVLEQLLLAKSNAPSDIGPRDLFNINYQLGALYQAIGVLDQAILVGEENENLAISNNQPYYEIFAIYTQLQAYSTLSNYTKVKELVDRAIKIKDQHNVSPAFGFAYYIQGKSYLEQEKLDSALHYFDLGEKISTATNSEKELSQNLLGKSKVFYQKGLFDKAEAYLDQAAAINKHEGDDILKLSGDLEAAKGNYRFAYQKATSLIDKLENDKGKDDNFEIISKLLSDKFTKEKEDEILVLKLQEEQFFRKLILGLLSGLIFMLGGFVFIQERNKRRLEKLNNSLTKRNEALINFNYISSHDLKEPVRNIISFSELLENELSTKKSAKKELEFAAIIKNSSKTLNEILKSLKIFSETAFDQEIKIEIFDVKTVFNDLKSNMQQLISEKNALVTFTTAETLPKIKFSKPMFYLLLQNLIQNALKYNSSATPKVEVSMMHQANNYLVSVKDNGQGIAPNQLDYIFKPFKTLQSKSLTQSSGLGLSICKNILDKFGGKIWVESELDKGSIFYFTIPENIK